MSLQLTNEEQKIWKILETVTDPEIPVLSILDLGIVRSVKQVPGHFSEDEIIEVIITPTYSGCPAMDMITKNIKIVLLEHGYKNITIKSVLSPAWTTDWMSEAGKEKLKNYGIAPPNPTQIVCDTRIFAESELFNAQDVIPTKRNLSVSLALPLAKHYTNARIAKNLLIILNAINNNS